MDLEVQSFPWRPAASGPSRPPGSEPPAHGRGSIETTRAALGSAEWQAWARLQQGWIDVVRLEGFDAHPGSLDIYLEAPVEARRSFPALSWAKAAAMAHSLPPGEMYRVLSRTLLQDAVSLHADWLRNPDTDAAVLSGTMWLTSQQTLYAEDGGSEEVWRTRNALAELIDRRRQQGDPPGKVAAAMFHAKSAQLALMRADAVTAVVEADRAVLLDSGPEGHASASLREVVLELHGTPENPSSTATPDSAPPSLIGQSAVLATIAQLAGCLRQLDAEGAERAATHLADLRAEPGWPIRIALSATRSAIWGDPERAMGQFNDDLGRNGVLSMEHHSPLGRRLLARVRSLLLCKLGSPVEALRLAQMIEPPWSWVPTARARLWAGELDGAIEAARSGLFADSRTWAADRISLSVLKAAAMTASTTREESERAGAYARAIAVCTSSQSISALALLPSFGLQAILDYHDRLACDGCILCHSATRARLAGIPVAQSSLTLVRLTPREKDLLPLLAGTAAVPAIARSLHVSVSTVRKQVATLRSKFGASTRQELISRARSAGYLRDEQDGSAPLR